MIRKFTISGLEWPVRNGFTVRSSRSAYRHLAVRALTLAICVLIVLKTPCARSQVVTATLQGTVQDHSGAMIQKATVTVTLRALAQALVREEKEGLISPVV